MTIRLLTLADGPQAVALWEQVGLTRPWNDPMADFVRAVTGPSSTVLGMYQHGAPGEGVLVGTAMAGYDGHRGWVYYLAVDPSRQGSGLGAALLAGAEQWLVDAGAPKVELMVRRDNHAVVGFYQRAGYSVEDVAVLSRWLTSGELGVSAVPSPAETHS